ncbi:MAG TPA: glycosyltransferase [Flavobacterium sp.]|jgi:glycosyltransferase involved in cell wall biosynthesis
MITTEAPLVSVDMITYKHEPYIRQAIEGVLSQETTFEYELIIADDCSPDGTQAIVEDILRSHPAGYRIKYFRHEKNIGMLANGKFAGEQCKAKYMALCEGDDYWIDPLKLQKQVSFLEENPDYLMTYHNRYILDFDGNMITESLGEFPRSIPKNRMISTFVPTATMVFRNDISDYLDVNMEDIFSADVALRAFMSTKGKAYFMPFFGSVYRQHAGGMSSSLNFLANRELWLKSRITIGKNIKGVSQTDLHFSKFVIMNDLFFHHLKNKQPLTSMKMLPKMLRSLIISRRIDALKILAGNIKSLYSNSITAKK